MGFIPWDDDIDISIFVNETRFVDTFVDFLDERMVSTVHSRFGVLDRTDKTCKKIKSCNNHIKVMRVFFNDSSFCLWWYDRCHFPSIDVFFQ
jgi:hypothetical protein